MSLGSNVICCNECHSIRGGATQEKVTPFVHVINVDKFRKEMACMETVE